MASHLPRELAGWAGGFAGKLVYMPPASIQDTGARLLSSEDVPSQGSGELLFINHSFDGGYNTYPEYLTVNRLPDAAAEPPSKGDFHLQVPKYSYAKVQLEPGFYTVRAIGGSVYRFEVSAGVQHAREAHSRLPQQFVHV